MTQTMPAALRAKIEAAALKAGMIDADGLKLLDLSTIKLTDAGEIEGVEALLTRAKETKPYLFGGVALKHASQMTDAEYATELGRLLAS